MFQCPHHSGSVEAGACHKSMHCAACHDSRAEDVGKFEDHGYQNLVDARFGIYHIPHNDLLFGVEWRKHDTADHADELSRTGGEVFIEAFLGDQAWFRQLIGSFRTLEWLS